MRLIIIAVSLALAATSCSRPPQPKTTGPVVAKPAAGSTAGQTPRAGATGQASEGSVDDRNAPARPSSR